MNHLLKQTIAIAALPLFVSTSVAADPADEPPVVVESDRAEGNVRVIIREVDEEVETRIVAFVGVGTSEVGPALAAQLGLPEGMGLLVEVVVDDSPAMAAGVEVNDVLVKFDDQMVVNTPQLTTLIRMKEPGETVKLTLIRKAQEQVIDVELGEQEVRPTMTFRMLPPGLAVPPAEFPGWAIDGRGIDRLDVDGLRFFRTDAEFLDAEEMREMFLDAREGTERAREALERLREFNDLRAPGVMGLRGPLPANGTVVISDSGADGSAATITRNADGLRFKLTQDGEVVFDGPVETDEQREALTDEQRERLEYLLDLLPEFVEEEPEEGERADAEDVETLRL
ncbi:MAG: PDZ domain-containing protein [Planctomycetota bacterium]